MSAKYGILFLTMAALAGMAGFGAASLEQRVVFACCGIAALLVGIAYLIGRPGLLFKRDDGSRPWWAWVLLWPYFGLSWTTFWLYRATSRGERSTEIGPGVWLSRRLLADELRGGREWAGVVDLTAEFPRVRADGADYLLLPVLDAAPPTVEQLARAVRWIEGQRARGPVLIHCALGHGRSASVVCAWLLATGAAGDVEAAVARVRAARPGVGLKAAQLARLDEYARGLSKGIRGHAEA